jgi:hypothetical protein
MAAVQGPRNLKQRYIGTQDRPRQTDRQKTYSVLSVSVERVKNHTGRRREALVR